MQAEGGGGGSLLRDMRNGTVASSFAFTCPTLLLPTTPWSIGDRVVCCAMIAMIARIARMARIARIARIATMAVNDLIVKPCWPPRRRSPR